MRPILILALLLVVVAACGEGDEGTTDEQNLNDLGDELTEAHCGKIFSCCSEAERFAAFQGIPIDDQEQCTSSVQGIVQVNVIPRYEDALAAGTISYSGEIQSCLDGFARLACDEFQPDPRLTLIEIPQCAALFEALLETTEFCTDDFECKTGFCAFSGGADEGTCAELPGEMESCIAGRCGEGLFCTGGVCSPRFDDGATCDVSSQCLSSNCVDVSTEGSEELECQPLPPACGG